jgi:KipI family sensor histidine kinase inhibitor
MMAAHVREAGDSALLVELEAVIDPEINARAIGVADALRARRIPGVRDVVSTFHSVAIHFDPLGTEPQALDAAVRAALDEAPALSTGRTIEVPVAYGGEWGPDLSEIAAFAHATPDEVVERHTSRPYRVYMLGFLPGYPYMAAVDDAIAAPRRAMPRLRVPAGSVGIAGRQTGIYPCESPGGWQIIGRTPLALFDAHAASPALCAPGDAVRFHKSQITSHKPQVTSQKSQITIHGSHIANRFITVLQPGLLTTIQDEGRWGYQHLGVPVAGPMDRWAHRLANQVLGNPRDAATLEATLVGPELRFEDDAWTAIAGADLQPSLDGCDAPMGVPVKCPKGSVLRFGPRRSGARAYVAVEGGIATSAVLGSRATHVLSRLGGIEGRALRAADRLPIGRGEGTRGASPPSPLASGGGARLRVLPGPQIDHFDPGAFEGLQRGRYTVSPRSDRMGYRLDGAPIPAPSGEMISNAAFLGGVQVPPSGEPILLMADRQTTGGYPQIAVVITADLPLAGQLAPGDWLEFRACSRAEALAALRGHEGQPGAIG